MHLGQSKLLKNDKIFFRNLVSLKNQKQNYYLLITVGIQAGKNACHKGPHK